MEKFSSLNSLVIPLLIDNIDTDQIIPARFLKTTDKNGLGDNLFADWRYLPDGSPDPDFVLNTPGAKEIKILLAGDNFGCGSSREHAPWALLAYGFKAVVATSFADIFRNNSLKNGLLPVEIDRDAYKAMREVLSHNPEAEFSIDLEHQTVVWPEGHESHFPIDAFSRTCLLKGVDQLGYILSFEDKIQDFESKL